MTAGTSQPVSQSVSFRVDHTADLSSLYVIVDKLRKKMLSNNNMLTTGGRSQRQRRSVRVNKPAYGFFITGSSIEAMNGVYVAR